MGNILMGSASVARCICAVVWQQRWWWRWERVVAFTQLQTNVCISFMILRICSDDNNTLHCSYQMEQMFLSVLCFSSHSPPLQMKWCVKMIQQQIARVDQQLQTLVRGLINALTIKPSKVMLLPLWNDKKQSQSQRLVFDCYLCYWWQMLPPLLRL